MKRPLVPKSQIWARQMGSGALGLVELTLLNARRFPAASGTLTLETPPPPQGESSAATALGVWVSRSPIRWADPQHNETSNPALPAGFFFAHYPKYEFQKLHCFKATVSVNSPVSQFHISFLSVGPWPDQLGDRHNKKKRTINC